MTKAVLRAGPLTVALLSGPVGAPAGRIGPRPLALAGTALLAAACGWSSWRAGRTPAHAADLLPGVIASGVGMSLVFRSSPGRPSPACRRTARPPAARSSTWRARSEA